VSSDGALVGVLGAEGRALSSASGAGFAAETWLQDDGDMALPKDAALRKGFTGPKAQRSFTLAGVTGVVLNGKTGLAALPLACAGAALVILPAGQPAPDAAPGPCRLIAAPFLQSSGALSLVPGQGGVWVVPVRRAVRIWDRQDPVMAPLFVPAEGAPARSDDQVARQ
jgi:competence protein ComEC